MAREKDLVKVYWELSDPFSDRIILYKRVVYSTLLFDCVEKLLFVEFEYISEFGELKIGIYSLFPSFGSQNLLVNNTALNTSVFYTSTVYQGILYYYLYLPMYYFTSYLWYDCKITYMYLCIHVCIVWLSRDLLTQHWILNLFI